jgi:hypothetical protein
MKRCRSKLTYANVVATLALCLVVAGGSALAASHLARNSVGTKQIKNGAVTAKKLHSGAVGTASIKDGAVSGSKLNLARVTAPNATNAANAGHAGSAGSAGDANAVSGNAVQRVFFHGAAGAGRVQVYSASSRSSNSTPAGRPARIDSTRSGLCLPVPI